MQLDYVDDVFRENFKRFEHIESATLWLSLTAVMIAVMGLFAIATYVAGQRRHEIGVRKTLGSSESQAVALIVAEFAKPALLGNLLSWPFAYLGARAYLDTFMHRIPLTPVPFVLGLALTLTVAAFAVGGQAYRAARVRPAEVLRDE